MVLLLLSWFTDPAVTPATLEVLANTIAALAPSFRHAAAFSVGILQSLIADTQQQVSDASIRMTNFQERTHVRPGPAPQKNKKMQKVSYFGLLTIFIIFRLPF